MAERALGASQEALMVGLELHGGFWHPNCGWLFGTQSETIRVLDSLEARGLVYTQPWKGSVKLYRLTLQDRSESPW